MSETKEFRRSFSKASAVKKDLNEVKFEIECYLGEDNADERWMDENPGKFELYPVRVASTTYST